jgi:hypothetical protein
MPKRPGFAAGAELYSQRQYRQMTYPMRDA